ncbi:MAG: type II toxin-antitoxin system ParD family antitoxin [Pseudomonadales bacterium]|nr:type II toxin-antitoxin system ParD family antitoxin [Pseudomonadales bacterium]
MPTTSFNLDSHWEAFIKNEVASGRYSNASEVIRDGLRHLEVQKYEFGALRAAIIKGEESGSTPFNASDTLAKIKKKAGLNESNK